MYLCMFLFQLFILKMLNWLRGQCAIRIIPGGPVTGTGRLVPGIASLHYATKHASMFF